MSQAKVLTLNDLIEKKNKLYNHINNLFENFEKENQCIIDILPCSTSKYSWKLRLYNPLKQHKPITNSSINLEGFKGIKTARIVEVTEEEHYAKEFGTDQF